VKKRLSIGCALVAAVLLGGGNGPAIEPGAGPQPVELAGDRLGPGFTAEMSQAAHSDWIVSEDDSLEGVSRQCHPEVDGWSFCYLFLDGGWMGVQSHCDAGGECPNGNEYSVLAAMRPVTAIVGEDQGDITYSADHSGLGWVGSSAQDRSGSYESLALTQRLWEYVRRGGSSGAFTPHLTTPEGEALAAELLRVRRLPSDPVVRDGVNSAPAPIKTVRNVDWMLRDHFRATLSLGRPAEEIGVGAPERGEFEPASEHETRVATWRTGVLAKIAAARPWVENTVWRVVLPATLKKYDLEQGCFTGVQAASQVESFERKMNVIGVKTSYEVAGIEDAPKIVLSPATMMDSVRWTKASGATSLSAAQSEVCVPVEDAKLLRAAADSGQLHVAVYVLRDLEPAVTSTYQGRWLGAALLLDSTDGYPPDKRAEAVLMLEQAEQVCWGWAGAA